MKTETVTMDVIIVRLPYRMNKIVCLTTSSVSLNELTSNRNYA
jgi:hypothetical protein